MTGEAEAAAIAAMRRLVGVSLTLRRPVSGGSPIDVAVVGTLRKYQPQELTGGVIQGDRWAKISDDEIVAAGWPGPPRTGDILLDGTQPYRVMGCNTVRTGDAVLSHTLQLRGGS